MNNYYTRRQVAQHCCLESCWIIVGDKIYDVTAYIQHHPGGRELLLEYGGYDATDIFLNKPHSDKAKNELETLLCGRLTI